MRRTSTILLLSTVLSVLAAPAIADTPGCVSRHEYDRIAKGMAMERVHKIFDTEGVETGLGGSGELRYYNTCTGRGVIQIGFDARDRVTSKNGRFF
jgi:hypothetical protein